MQGLWKIFITYIVIFMLVTFASVDISALSKRHLKLGSFSMHSDQMQEVNEDMTSDTVIKKT